MEKKQIKFIAVLLAIVLLALGCFIYGKKQSTKPVTKAPLETTKPEQTNTTPTETVCILLGYTRNVPRPDEDIMKNEFAQMAEHVADCSVIVIDGEPTLRSYTTTVRYPKALPFLQEDSNSNYIKRTMKKVVNNCEPKAAEIDILGALRSAEKELSRHDDTKKRILIFSSGISTTGALNFAKNPKLIEENPDIIVNMLKESKSLPDLTDVEIVWRGFSVVEEPQKRLSDINEYRLENLWRAILTACNATIVSFESEIGSVSNYSVNEVKKDYPQVSVVEFPDVIDIDETKVQFKPRTAEFLDEDKVRAELKPYAEMILQSGCKNFYLVGSTASISGNAECLKLSIERAEAVKNVLCSYGVPASFLETYGIGRENFGGEYKWRINDLKADGKSLDEALAQQNRKVMIIEQSSDKGVEFKHIWDETMT